MLIYHDPVMTLTNFIEGKNIQEMSKYRQNVYDFEKEFDLKGLF